MLAGEFTPGFKLGLHHKDLTICKSMLENVSENSLPILEMTLVHYQRLMEQGYGDEDISALFRLKQEQFRK
jgi:3-hydroxyisobutyrate dehydrogenase